MAFQHPPRSLAHSEQAISGWLVDYRDPDEQPHYYSGLSASLPLAQCTGLQNGRDWLGGDITPERKPRAWPGAQACTAMLAPPHCGLPEGALSAPAF